METAEITALLREVREKVRARYPQQGGSRLPLADLMPAVHARDAAEAKVAAIGTVNPRAGGPVNALVQALKRLVARALDWHVREQVEFNRQTLAAIDAMIEALNEVNRALAVAGDDAAALRANAEELKDMRSHWAAWRAEWESKLSSNEIQFLRSVSDLQGAFQHRVTVVEAAHREAIARQHAEFTREHERGLQQAQQALWQQFAQVRLDFERMIHSELRVARQRAMAAPVTPAAPAAHDAPEYDDLRFADRFRGSEDYVRASQRFYVPHFVGRSGVLDIGCGRGEFLEVMREAGASARGIDLSAEAVAICTAKGLDAKVADLFVELDSLPDGALGGIFCSQVIEHLTPAQLPRMIRLCALKLERGGLVAIETPNPECLAIFATHFYLDPTHQRPVPHPLLGFYLEEAGFGGIETHRRAPAAEAMPSLATLPAEFREAFFGALDYAMLARKL